MTEATMHVAVVIAHHGHKNDPYLTRVLEEWDGMKEFTAHVTVLTEAALASGADPTGLPFLARVKLMERLGGFDIYVYSEDDILISERNLKAWCEITAGVGRNEVAGFLRYEVAPSGERRFPDMHAAFRWENLQSRLGQHFAEFSNRHAGCYALTGWQLRIALESGKFLVPMHADATYGTLERGAADIYLQCGLTRLIPLSRFDEFLVHHLPNNYLDLGKPESVVRAELKAMGVEWP